MRFLYILLILSSIFIQELAAQDTRLLKNKLQAVGFEQIEIVPVEKVNGQLDYKIFLEHRGINNPSEVIRLAKLISLDLGFSNSTLVFLHRGIILFELPINSINNNGSFTKSSFELNYNRSFSISKYRFNAFFLPEPSIRFGYFEDPLQSKINLLVGSDIMLFKGASIFTSVNIPITNNLDNEGLNPRIGPTFFDYVSILDRRNFFRASAGIFFNNRFGLDLQYLFNDFSKPWSLGFRYARTGFYFAPKGGVFFNSIKDQMAVLNLEYLFSNRITASLELGQFLGLDQGVKASFFKQYKNVEIGFFVTYTDAGQNGGFSFMIPLLPRKIIRSKGFEFRGFDSFRWEYNYSNTGSVGQVFNRYHQLSTNFRRFKFDLMNSYE